MFKCSITSTPICKPGKTVVKLFLVMGELKKEKKVMLYSSWKIPACQWELLGYYKLF